MQEILELVAVESRGCDGKSKVDGVSTHVLRRVHHDAGALPKGGAVEFWRMTLRAAAVDGVA